MRIDADTKVADIAVANPATIKVFQSHGIDFCCGGKVRLADACKHRGLDAKALVLELQAARTEVGNPIDWTGRSLGELAYYIQERYHEPLRIELSRLSTMAARVAERHGERSPRFEQLHRLFDGMRDELLDHMAREDAVLFPLIVAMEEAPSCDLTARASLQPIVRVMTQEHDRVGEALAAMRTLTDGYTPPSWACPTLLGLYHGLAEFERDMQVHVHLENVFLFPGALEATPQS